MSLADVLLLVERKQAEVDDAIRLGGQAEVTAFLTRYTELMRPQERIQ